jgi:hypothetical protein
MIKEITGGQYLVIEGGEGFAPPYLSNGQATMMVRWNNITRRFEVDTDHSWQPLVQTSSRINLSQIAQSAIDWAVNKMQEEKELEQLAAINPAIKAAVDTVKRAEIQLKTTLILSKNETSTS